MSGAPRLRFAGKIYGTGADYWIAVGSVPTSEEDSKDQTIEARGKGVNETVFWVTDNLLNDWIQLPDCRPQDIISARSIKHIFTGNLNADVDTNPPFAGKERHLLRAQLARIFHATALVPKGLFETDEETGLPKFSEEFTFPKTDALKEFDSWCNVHEQILFAGRCEHLQPEVQGEEDPEAAMAALLEKDPKADRFRVITEHAPVRTNEQDSPAWTSKVVGDAQLFSDQGAEGGDPVSYAVNVIKSVRWPGSVTVSKGGKCTTVYVGYGLKKGDPSYNPTQPPNVCADPSEIAEMFEPHEEEKKAAEVVEEDP